MRATNRPLPTLRTKDSSVVQTTDAMLDGVPYRTFVLLWPGGRSMLFVVPCLNGLARRSFASRRMRSLIVVAAIVTEFAVPNRALARSHEGLKPDAPTVASEPCAAAMA